jgi:hypothetical protein
MDLLGTSGGTEQSGDSKIPFDFCFDGERGVLDGCVALAFVCGLEIASVWDAEAVTVVIFSPLPRTLLRRC